MAMEKLPMWL